MLSFPAQLFLWLLQLLHPLIQCCYSAYSWLRYRYHLLGKGRHHLYRTLEQDFWILSQRMSWCQWVPAKIEPHFFPSKRPKSVAVVVQGVESMGCCLELAKLLLWFGDAGVKHVALYDAAGNIKRDRLRLEKRVMALLRDRSAKAEKQPGAGKEELTITIGPEADDPWVSVPPTPSGEAANQCSLPEKHTVAAQNGSSLPQGGVCEQTVEGLGPCQTPMCTTTSKRVGLAADLQSLQSTPERNKHFCTRKHQELSSVGGKERNKLEAAGSCPARGERTRGSASGVVVQLLCAEDGKGALVEAASLLCSREEVAEQVGWGGCNKVKVSPSQGAKVALEMITAARQGSRTKRVFGEIEEVIEDETWYPPLSEADVETALRCVGRPTLEPDLVLVFGEAFSLSGFPPWLLRNSEIVHAGNLRSAHAGSILWALHHFARTTQRFGR